MIVMFFCNIYSLLHFVELRIDNLEHIEAQIPITLCKLEKIFPPSFFDVMVHLPVHLAIEAKIAEPIHYRWMYPVERWEFAKTHENAHHLSDIEWNRQFIEWFKNRVAQLQKGDSSRIMEDLLSLSREDYDKKLRTQNCGVVVLGENDKDSENLDYYGVFTDMIELQFVMDRRATLFSCNWFDVHDEIKGVKKDEYDFVVRKTQPRDSYEIVEQMDDAIVELGSPSQKKRKRANEVKFKMKPLKTENEADSFMESTISYTLVAPGAIGKGRG
ncbi:hypothetical protein KY290_008048 [Solanum tuberosum]|uniref:DUF4218 domain-containing protein n=1 Tax=Solanum tuberosum TaxID=4113 RepID=A0ABQ7W7B6_SOLTU|nr:hypothetical protein KY290_008048 [Solanum tuberosum]